MEYKVKFVDMPKHYQILRDEILSTIDGVLSRGDVILRDDLSTFEKNIAEYVGAEYAVGLNSGFDALHLSVGGLDFVPTPLLAHPGFQPSGHQIGLHPAHHRVGGRGVEQRNPLVPLGLAVHQSDLFAVVPAI